MKICSVCEVEKSLSEYYARSSRCKACHKEYTRQHYKDNVEVYVEKAKRNKERVREKNKAG